MKISYADYIKKTDASVLVAEAIFSELYLNYPIKKIADVAKTTSGGTPNRGNKEFYNGGIPWLKSGELNDGIIEKSEEFISEEGLVNSSAKLFPKDTLLLAMYGATAGKTGITQIETATNQAICALFPNKMVVQPYLFWFLRQHRHKFIEISKGGSQPNISQSVINDTKLPVPNKDLQLTIATILFKIEKEKTINLDLVPIEFRNKVNTVLSSKNNVFEISAELSKQLNLVKKLRQQFLQEAVQGLLLPNAAVSETGAALLKRIQLEKAKSGKKEKPLPPIKAEEIPFEIPDNWVWCRLGELCDNITKGSSPKWQGVQYVKEGEGILYITSKNVDSFKIDLTNSTYVEQKFNEIEPRSILKKGDLLTNIVGGSIGRTAIYDLDIVANINQAVCILRAEHDCINKNYLLYLMNSDFALKMMFDNQFAPGRANLSMGNIANFTIPLPPLSIQAQLVTKLETLMSLCDGLTASIQASQSQNESLLQQVLREALSK